MLTVSFSVFNFFGESEGLLPFQTSDAESQVLHQTTKGGTAV
jgi:hypothetical protein